MTVDDLNHSTVPLFHRSPLQRAAVTLNLWGRLSACQLICSLERLHHETLREELSMTRE